MTVKGGWLASTIAAIASLAAWPVLACVEQSGLERVYAAVRPAIVRISTLGPGEGCSTHGAGFFISPEGEVMTAKHVVPESCESQTILVAHEGDLNGFRVEVSRRSAIDIAVLRPAKALSSTVPHLEIDRETPEPQMVGQRIVVSSFPEQYMHANWTAAKVDAVARQSDPLHWMICGPAANPGRSGSAVITAQGKAIAIFVERPAPDGMPLQDVAKVLPIRRLPDVQLRAAAGGVGAALLPGGGPLPNLDSVAYSYPIRLVTTDPPSPLEASGRSWIRMRDKQPPEIMRVDQVNVLRELALVAEGWMLRFESLHELNFEAFPGYKFEPDSVRMVVESHNPRFGPLADRPCGGLNAAAQPDVDCFVLSGDRRWLTLRLRLFRGPVGDAARGWLSGELQTRQTVIR